MLTVVKELNQDNKIILYTYNHKGKDFVALIPTDKKQYFLDNKIIEYKKIIADYDIDKEIEEEYGKYLKCQ